jgi:hypothetical protein
MTEQAQLTRHDLEAKIVKHAWEDEAFRKEFIADPAGTFVKYLQAPASSLPKIVVHEEPAGSWHIVLPAEPPNTNELSDTELEKVAGGATPIITPVASGVVITVITITEGVSQAEGGW